MKNLNPIIVGKDQRLVILRETIGGIYESIPSDREAEYFNSLETQEQAEYLEKNFFSLGFAEGADNLVEVSEAMENYSWDELVVVIQQV